MSRQAKGLLSKVLDVNPWQAKALHLSAVLESDAGQTAAARRLFR